ncbi:molybdate ABC transporter substrate-binding protein [Methanospirillum stamsii]|uniref:Molybdate ABC transporter substrate-binding protein n=1 Tax=Methanospirillum stamsii TaxID=1277351 RepID=A0A2V2NBS0_9EURY|nr:molybdate ABC transporter substrate-binding protein [Methanospirillum stamsii]PWR76035.1 molybdate ABC transporter substrate-binding protein [Methanospirillum stamsii]
MNYSLSSLACFFICLLVVFLPAQVCAADNAPESLFVYSGAGLKGPMTEIGEAFEEKTGIPVEFNFAGSGTLISQMEISKKGDAFIPGGTPDYAIAQNKSLVTDPVYVAYHVPVIGVLPGNPQGIESVQDFTKEGLKLALGDVNATAIGRQGQKLFDKLGIADEIEKNVVLRAPTINEVVTALKLKQVDASLITIDQIKGDEIEAVPLVGDESIALVVPIGLTTFTTQKDSAQQFVDFVSSDEGKAIFKKHGHPIYPDPAYADVKL